MVCSECQNNQNYKNMPEKLLLSLDTVKSMSLDETINLYKQGYRLEQSYDSNNLDIKSLAPCAILAAQFQKNGTTNFPCTATLADSIGFDATIQIQPSDVGKSVFCYFDIRYPDQTTHEFYTYSTAHTITSSDLSQGTIEFALNKFDTYPATPPVSLTTGTYSLISCYILLSDKSTQVCGPYIGGNCTSIQVSAAPTTTTTSTTTTSTTTQPPTTTTTSTTTTSTTTQPPTTTTTSTTTTPAPGTGSITFTVSSSGVPLSGAAVSVDGSLKGTTDSLGNRTVTGLTVGISHSYTITKTGFNTVSSATTLDTSTKSVPINMTATTTPSAGVGGTVVIVAAFAAIGLAYILMRKK